MRGSSLPRRRSLPRPGCRMGVDAPIGVAEPRGELQFDEPLDGKHCDSAHAVRDRWIGKRDWLREPIARKITGDDHVDLHVVLGVSHALRSWESLDPAAPDVPSLERLEPFASQQEIHVRRHTAIPIGVERPRSRQRVRNALCVERGAHLHERLLNLRHSHKQPLGERHAVSQRACSYPSSRRACTKALTRAARRQRTSCSGCFATRGRGRRFEPRADHRVRRRRGARGLDRSRARREERA